MGKDVYRGCVKLEYHRCTSMIFAGSDGILMRDGAPMRMNAPPGGAAYSTVINVPSVFTATPSFLVYNLFLTFGMSGWVREIMAER